MIDLASTISPPADQRRDLVEGDPLDGHVLLLDALQRRLGRLEIEGQVHEGVLVGEPGRVVELAEPFEPSGPHADLLDQLPMGGDLGRLAGDVTLAGRDLEQLPVDGRPVLADHDRPRSDGSTNGTADTAPGWWTMSRSNGEPSGPAKVPRATEISDPR